MTAHVVLRGPSNRVGLRLATRTLLVGGVLLALLGVLIAVALITGRASLSLGEVLPALFGGGDNPGTNYIVWTLRMPRVLAAVLVGAALAISGAIFQRLTRNALGSPDFIGFSNGAATGAVLQILLFGAGPMAVVGGALVGGAVTAVLVYGLAYRRGVAGYRLVLVGIGISAVLLSLNHYLLVRAELSDAYRAAIWLTGSLNGRSWDHVAVLAGALVLCLPVALLLSRQLTLLEMGNDLAYSLGVPVERTRLALIAAGVGLVAAATATAGPIAFVALASPHIARRLTRTAGAGLVTTGLLGAVLLLISDIAVQVLFESANLPVGLATGAIGGVYLTVLLSRRWRARIR
ncbi:iron complex transport system permease protein [Tamaricihabitans halophyticus]|uniref:Iron complex transport system permease protein n=1 Tax=Tamaricihabitans halophyticus TaxID=1262583 RepID=A0A4R2R5X8_9PSEU|nr:iron chelate uptake ABC transporter family permease subunit [Tamaricihabitans halophyticus]TCP54981.1 iron complex transport system permease protein [Tamaricihabitans halophyticus]